LSEKPRKTTSIQVVEDLIEMTYKKDIFEWAQVLDKADLPHHYELTFAAFLSTLFSLIMPFWAA